MHITKLHRLFVCIDRNNKVINDPHSTTKLIQCNPICDFNLSVFSEETHSNFSDYSATDHDVLEFYMWYKILRYNLIFIHTF